MHSLDGLTKFGIIAKIVMFDLIAGLFLAWLVIDNPRRIPFMLIAVPVLVCANVAIAWWKFQNESPITLPAVYLFGLAFGIVWTVEEFEWWKLPLLLVPLAFFIRHIQRHRRVLASQAKR